MDALEYKAVIERLEAEIDAANARLALADVFAGLVEDYFGEKIVWQELKKALRAYRGEEEEARTGGYILIGPEGAKVKAVLEEIAKSTNRKD